MAKEEEVKSNRFEILGFYKNYWVNGRLMGSVRLEKPDRKTLGWGGKTKETLKDSVYLADTKRTLKKGTEALTECNALYGRSKVKFFGMQAKK